MAAGIVGLTEVFTPEAAQALNARGDALRERLNALCRARDAPMQFTGIGSMMAVHAHDRPMRSPADAASGDAKLKELFFFDMLGAASGWRGAGSSPCRCRSATPKSITSSRPSPISSMSARTWSAVTPIAVCYSPRSLSIERAKT